MLNFNRFLDISEGKRGKKRRAKERAKKRGSYQNTKLIKKKMPADDAAKASDEVLKDIVARGGASASSAASELKKRDVEVPEKGSEDPNDDPLNKGEGDTTDEPEVKKEPESEKEPESKEEPKKDDSERKKKISSIVGIDLSDDSHKSLSMLDDDYISENKDKIKKILSDDDTKGVLDGIEDPDKVKEALDKSEEMISKRDEIMSSIESSSKETDDEKKDEYDWDVISSKVDFEDKEEENKFKKFLDNTKIGGALQWWVDLEPTEMPGFSDAQEGIMKKIIDKINASIDKGIEKRAEKKTKEKEIDSLSQDATDADLDDMIKKGGEKGKIAKEAKKKREEMIKRYKDVSNNDLKDKIRSGGQEGKDAEKELNRRKNSVDVAKEKLTDKYGSLSDVDFEKAKETLGADLAQELVDLGVIKKGKKKTEESYQDLHNTILSMNENETDGKYRSLHSIIRQVWGIEE